MVRIYPTTRIRSVTRLSAACRRSMPAVQFLFLRLRYARLVRSQSVGSIFARVARWVELEAVLRRRLSQLPKFDGGIDQPLCPFQFAVADRVLIWSGAHTYFNRDRDRLRNCVSRCI